MGILAFKESDSETVKVHFSSTLPMFKEEVSEKITLLQNWLIKNEKYKKDFKLENSVNDAGEYFVFKNDDCFYYLGFVTKRVRDYYTQAKKKWALPKIDSGEYGNYFIPDKNEKKVDLFRLYNGAIYYPKKKSKTYYPLIVALKSAFGDFLDVGISSHDNGEFAPVSADKKLFKVVHKVVKFNRQKKIDRVLGDL